MVKSELYSNLRDVVELLYDSLLPEGSNAVSCRDSEEELNLLQEEISALDYSCLDEIYHAGPEEVVNDDLSPIENALISSVGLLDEYSLSEKEFREWMRLLSGSKITSDIFKTVFCTLKWPENGRF